MKSNILIWFCVNRDGQVRMFLDEPKRNVKAGRFEGTSPYVNTIIYRDMCEVVKQAKMNFETDPQAIEIQIQQ